MLRHTSDQLVMTRAELGQLQQQHGGCGERVSELRAELEAAERRAESEGRRAEELQSLLRAAEARIEREDGRVRELQRQVEAAREREGRLRVEVEEVRGQMAAARKEAVESREELRRARGAGEAAREGREEAERQLLVAGVRLEELRLDCQVRMLALVQLPWWTAPAVDRVQHGLRAYVPLSRPCRSLFAAFSARCALAMPWCASGSPHRSWPAPLYLLLREQTACRVHSAPFRTSLCAVCRRWSSS